MITIRSNVSTKQQDIEISQAINEFEKDSDWSGLVCFLAIFLSLRLIVIEMGIKIDIVTKKRHSVSNRSPYRIVNNRSNRSTWIFISSTVF